MGKSKVKKEERKYTHILYFEKGWKSVINSNPKPPSPTAIDVLKYGKFKYSETK